MSARRILTRSASAAALTVLSFNPAVAQDDLALEEIVVAAQKRAEDVQDVPIAITALTAQELERSGIQDITRLSAITPGFTFNRSGGDARPSIRGVSTENIQATGDPTIGFFVDEVYQSRTFMAMAHFVDVERLEVLRGPQGTLFGRNTLGGAISVFSREPIDEFDAYLTVNVGNYGRGRVEGAVNFPLSDTIAVRVAAMTDNANGYLKNSAGQDLYDRDDQFARVSLRFTPNDRLDIVARASIARQDGIGPGAYGYTSLGTYRTPDTGRIALPQHGGVSYPFQGIPNGDGIVDVDFPDDAGGPVDLGFPVLANFDQVALNTDPWVDTNDKSFSLNVEYDFGPVVLKSITARNDVEYQRFYDGDLSDVFETLTLTFSTFGSIQGQIDDFENFSQEIQLASNTEGPFQWVAGLFWLQDELEEFYLWGIENDHPTASAYKAVFGAFAADLFYNTNNGQEFTGYFFPIVGSDGRIDVDSQAVFGQGSYAFSDQWRATLGVRSTRDEKALTDGTLSVDFDAVTTRLGVEYASSDDTMYYASRSTGFLSGGLNTALEAGTPRESVDEQTNTAWEFGVKSRFRDGLAQLNVALFRNDIEDVIVQIPGASLSTIRVNGGEVEVTGLEAELKLLLSANARVDVAFSMMDSELSNFVVRNPWIGAPGMPAEENTVDLSGNNVGQTPDFTATVVASYDFDLGDMGSLTPQIQYAYSDGYFNDDFNSDVGYQDAYGMLDFRLFWASADGQWTAQAFVENATDEEVITRSVLTKYTTFDASVWGEFAPPRMYGLSVSYNF